MGASGAVLGAFFEDFRRWVGKRKTLKNVRFFWLFKLLGDSEEVSEASSGLSWTMFARGLCFFEDFRSWAGKWKAFKNFRF